MSYSGEAADQVVRLSLNGVEVAAKLSGSAAKQLAIMIYAILKDQKKTKGKIRLTNMLRSGKELKVFAVKDGDLQKFCEEAKKQNLLLVPGSSFACPGYVRLAYCVSYEMILRSLPHFEELMKKYR